MITTSDQGLLYLPHSVCTLLRETRLCCMQTTKAQISLRIRATCKNRKIKIKFHRQTCVCGSDPDNSKGGGGGGVASRGKFVPVFLLGNKWQLVIFQGEVRGPCPHPSCLRPYLSFHIDSYQGLSIPENAWTYVLPGLVITNSLLIISIDVKGKDSLILFKI